jgi:Holliday junction resolvase RusA-like endonuclease
MIVKFIQGIPYARHKRRGDIEAPKRWTDAVIRQTEDLPKVLNACLLKLTFCLPPDKFPTDLPYGPDLDNLAKRTLDALQRTVFSDAKGHDSCVVALIAMKTKVSGPDDAGVHLEVLPVAV